MTETSDKTHHADKGYPMSSSIWFIFTYRVLQIVRTARSLLVSLVHTLWCLRKARRHIQRSLSPSYAYRSREHKSASCRGSWPQLNSAFPEKYPARLHWCTLELSASLQFLLYQPRRQGFSCLLSGWGRPLLSAWRDQTPPYTVCGLCNLCCR